MKGYRQLTLLYGLLLMVVAIPVAIYLVEQNADSRNMAANKRGCVEQCPGRDGVLRNCTPPEADGSSEDSVCNVANRVQMCGGKCYVCPSPNGKWKVDDALKCAGTTVVPSIPAGQVGVLNYQISFGGVNPNNAQCTIDWPLKFIILGDGETKVYQNVIPKNKFVLNNKMVFIGSLKLTGFTRLNNLAVFIRGPKHLQVKYGKNNQTGSYNQAGGEIMVTESEVLSPLYDFSGYPLMPGDVVGTYSEQQDDMINGVDFSYIKSKSLEHETIADGGNLKADLDGNCQVNSNDVNLLKITLQDRQGQLY
ncbi:hypothetical protein CO168_00800 [Candidatus Shapirobacteria bacterium CG_4_9_14_3_um_filter_36_12]|uniref:Uncharacterized protein n=1 Tax=Candidatus Shapirobacteria bacterium CG_4_9_14_3_um_filter_36_12 TaxID=1974877 RepID=A0A2M7XNU2_9BACT|nr:MAG: hypothetical protein CO168_00800 [Candidatus Shapirobacteria bacterium CG_4_9_14_3_um_filter_36_12]